MSETCIRVLIADDHTIVRKGLRALLSTKDDITVVGEVGDGLAAVQQALALRPDIILMDITMPGIDGVEATRRILAHQPGARILVLTSFSTDDKVFPALKAGAQGYLLKDSEPEDLVSAIRRIHHGESSLHPAVASRVLLQLAHPAAPAHSSLTDREIEVTCLIARGLKNRAIAAQLNISETTVRAHASNILAKLHLATRTELTLYALREGLAVLEDAPKEAG
jgi:NarL family two-component system response regulator LiaR